MSEPPISKLLVNGSKPKTTEKKCYQTSTQSSISLQLEPDRCIADQQSEGFGRRMTIRSPVQSLAITQPAS